MVALNAICSTFDLNVQGEENRPGIIDGLTSKVVRRGGFLELSLLWSAAVSSQPVTFEVQMMEADEEASLHLNN